MSAILTALLAALGPVLADIPSFKADWATISSLFSSETQAAVNALIASQEPKTEADVAQLQADAAAAAQG